MTMNEELPAAMSGQPDHDTLYRRARLAVIGKIDYWNEKDDPGIHSIFLICQKLASENYGKAYYLLSMLYHCKQDSEDGQDRARHFEQLAFNWSFTNQANDDVELWCDLGDLYQDQEVDDNFEQAALWFYKAAEKGYSEAQYNLSHACRLSLGVSENKTEALKWCQLAADQGHAIAQANLIHIKRELAAHKKSP